MYFLNDKHPEYEFAIYCQCKTATPYIAAILNSMQDVRRYLETRVKRCNQFGQIYYIDNIGFKNDYSKAMCNKGFYFKILKRKVNDWKIII